MADSTWKVLSSKVVHKNPWYQVRKDDVIRPNGEKGEYYIVETPGPSVIIVALTEQEEIYLVKQFRYQTNSWVWELPGGQAGLEDPLLAAARELEEETGLIAGSIEEVATNQVMNGLVNETGHVFLARNLTQRQRHQEVDEEISKVRKFPLREVLQFIKEGSFIDGQSISAMLQALLHLGHTIS